MRNSNIPSAAPTGPQHPSAAARGPAVAPGTQGCSAPGDGTRTRGFGGVRARGGRAHRGPSRGEGRSHAQSRAALGSPRSRTGSGHRRVPPGSPHARKGLGQRPLPTGNLQPGWEAEGVHLRHSTSFHSNWPPHRQTDPRTGLPQPSDCVGLASILGVHGKGGGGGPLVVNCSPGATSSSFKPLSFPFYWFSFTYCTFTVTADSTHFSLFAARSDRSCQTG